MPKVLDSKFTAHKTIASNRPRPILRGNKNVIKTNLKVVISILTSANKKKIMRRLSRKPDDHHKKELSSKIPYYGCQAFNNEWSFTM